jgi:hypothetical protein
MKAMVCAHKVNMREELLQQTSALQKASTTLQCFVRFQVLWSHKSENASKPMETCLSVERQICNCTFNNISQEMHNAPLSFLIYLLYFKNS